MQWTAGRWTIGEVARMSGLTWKPPACLHKIRHETLDSARAHLFDVQFHHDDDGDTLEIYPCSECQGWHVGRTEHATARHRLMATRGA